jgi:hypothetical protein
MVLVRAVTTRTELRFALLLLSAPLIIGAAYLFHLAFERPFLSHASSVMRQGSVRTPDA